jgi:methylation protein EvaC
VIGCRVCRSSIEPFIDFGRMPLANGFLTPDQFAGEYFFNLSAAACPRCTLVQLIEQPERERMFNDRYPFFSATSARMQEHFAALAGDVIAALPAGNPLVVEIGSNDGTLLRHAARTGIRHLGVEPSASVAQAAGADGVNTMCRFFDVAAARQIVAEHGHAHAIIATNALSHIADLHSAVEGIAILLAPDGSCVIEDPYWGDVVARTAFDQIYDEHSSYFTLSSLSWLFAQHGLEVLDAMPFDVHGGSMRYVIGRTGSKPPSPRVGQLRDREHALELHGPDTLAGIPRSRERHCRSADVAPAHVPGRGQGTWPATARPRRARRRSTSAASRPISWSSSAIRRRPSTARTVPARTSPCGRTPNSRRAIRTGHCCSCGITPRKYGPRNRPSHAAVGNGSSTCRR